MKITPYSIHLFQSVYLFVLRPLHELFDLMTNTSSNDQGNL